MHEKEIQTLRRLAAGRDPVSGRELAKASPYRREDVLAAITAAIAILDDPARRDFPARNGKPWTDEEIARLLARHDAGEAPEAIARRLERSPRAIVARLVQLGRMEAPAGLRLRYPVSQATAGD